MEGRRKQIFVNVLGLLMMYVSGIAYSFLGPVTVKLSKEHEGHFIIMGCLVAALDLGCSLTAIFSVSLADRYGRKPIINGSLVLYIFGWALFLFAQSIWTLTAARLIHGIANGIVQAVLPTYMIEITEPSLRRFLPGSFQFAMFGGVFYASLLGPYLSWENYCRSCFLLPFALACAFTQCPESPYYLLKHRRDNEAIEVLKSLRHSPDINSELETIKDSLYNCQSYYEFVKSLIFDKVEKRGFLIAQIAKSAMSLSGMPIIMNYTLELFSKSLPFLEAYAASIMLLLIIFGLCILFILIPGKCDLLLVMVVSCLFCSFTNMVVAQYLFLECTLETPPCLGFLYVPLVVYSLCTVVGMGFFSELMQAKMYGVITSGMGRGLTVTINANLSFWVLFTYNVIREYYGNWVNFRLYSFICLVIGLASTNLYFFF